MEHIGKNALKADEILMLHKKPLFSVDGFDLAQGNLRVTGIALPPGGLHSLVSIETSDGIDATFQYPLENPSATEYYWYWQNSGRSQYVINIDLAKSSNTSNAFDIMFNFSEQNDAVNSIRNTIYIPKNLAAYQNFPTQSSLSRVQHFDTISGVVVRGYSDYRKLYSLSKHYGLELDTATVLDWGCGHGRVIRHFAELGDNCQRYGVDIDPENIKWASENLSSAVFSVGPLMPPLKYKDNTFDFIFGISVMTHLNESIRRAWLHEIKRILKPGGIAMLTYSGDTDIAFTSRALSAKYISSYIEKGVGGDLGSSDLDSVAGAKGYYQNCKVSAPMVKKQCAEFFDVLDVLDCMFGYQDLAVLKKAVV